MDRKTAVNNLLNAVRLVVMATKTYDYFVRVLTDQVWALYRGDIEEGDFVTRLSDLIPQQLTRAWNEGMRTNDLNPEQDMEPEWQAILDGIILGEFDYVDGFAADISDARDEQLPIEPLLARADIWANRYNDVVNRAIVVTKEQKLLWVYGDTEHCSTCAALNGIVAWASEWEEMGVHPQQPENNKLECGGWHCQCTLIPTANRHTRNGIQAISDALG